MELIDKDALVAEIERLKDEAKIYPSYFGCGRLSICKELMNFLDTLEVKEVNIDFQMFAKEMDAIFALPSSETKNTKENPLNWEYAIAKHFFELGMQQSKNNNNDEE